MVVAESPPKVPPSKYSSAQRRPRVTDRPQESPPWMSCSISLLHLCRQLLTELISSSVTVRGAGCAGISEEDREGASSSLAAADRCRESSEGRARSASREGLSSLGLKGDKDRAHVTCPPRALATMNALCEASGYTHGRAPRRLVGAGPAQALSHTFPVRAPPPGTQCLRGRHAPLRYPGSSLGFRKMRPLTHVHPANTGGQGSSAIGPSADPTLCRPVTASPKAGRERGEGKAGLEGSSHQLVSRGK